jgi:hypothetical protein
LYFCLGRFDSFGNDDLFVILGVGMIFKNSYGVVSAQNLGYANAL